MKTLTFLLPTRLCFLLFLLLAGGATGFAQLSITSAGTNFTQNFDGMGSTAGATIPGGFKAGASSDHTSNGTSTTVASNAPASNATGACYNFGNASSTGDRALGFLNSSGYTSPKYITLQVTNNTGAAITGFTISWNYEKYRSGARAWNWTFFHGAGSTPGTAATAGDQAFAIDAANTTTYNPPQSTAKSVTLSGLNIANGASYYFLWSLTGVGGSTNGQGLGIDDFVINATAPCTAPTTQASAITFPTVNTNSVNVNWTNGNGGGRVVLMNTVNTFTTPTNGSNPTASTAYSGSGQQVVFNGTGSGPITVTGLTPSTTYYFRVFEFCTPTRNYQSSTGTNNPNSVTTLTPACTAPTTPASGVNVSSYTNNSATVNWTNGNGGGRVLMINTVNSFGIPVNGTNPTANTAYTGSGSQTVYNGTGSGPVTITGLTPGTTYYFRVYEFCTPDRNYLGTGAAGTFAIPTISTSSTPGSAPYTLADCAATATGTISYTKAGTYTAGNVFTAELSDASGSFAAPLSIGSVSSTNNGSINITIPAGTASGTGYKIRVVSSTPVVTGSESSNFTITQNGVCASLASHYFRSVQDGAWNQTSTWESSPDQITWINATLAPTAASSGILIQSGDSVTISSTGVTLDQTTVETGAILHLTNTGGLTLQDGPGDDLIIDGMYLNSLSNTGNIVITGTGRIHSGGILRSNSGTTGIISQYVGNNATAHFYYEDGAIFEYHASGIFTTSGQTYFPNASTTEIAIFRISLSNLGANGPVDAVFNGVLEQADGVNVTWSGTGSKTFRNGIRLGTGSTMAQTTGAPFFITGSTAVFDGPGTLVLNSSGLISTATISNGADITVNTTGANASFSGVWIGGGHSITGTAEMLYTGGANITNETTFQRFGTDGGAGIAPGTGNMQTVTEYAALRSGTLSTNGNLTFVSNASGTAYLNDFSAGFTGTVSGNIRMQRYNPVGLDGFRQLGTPVQIPNISGVSGFTPSGTAGFVIPVPTCDPNYVAYNSPYGNWMQLVENGTVQYSCSQSLFQVLTSGGMTSGRGYYMDVPATSTLTFTGAPTTGIVSFGLTHANTAVTNGWNMVSNPYPSPLAWELLNVPAGVDAIGKIWVTSGTYTGTWQDLDPSAAGTQAVAIGQAFQVRVTVPGTSVPFLVDNLDRTTSAPTYLFAGGDAMTLNIDILGNGFADVTKVRFMEGAGASLDAAYDSPKMLGNANQPMVYTVWNGQNYSTNSYGALTEVYTLPLGIKLAQTGEHTLAFSNVDQFPASALIYLEDTQTGLWQNVRANDTYTFTQAVGVNETRFLLHFYPPVQHTVAEATCDAPGQIILANEAPIQWNYALGNAQNQPVAQGVLANTQILSQLPAGIYTLTLTEPTSGYVATETVTVGGAQAITAQATASSVQVETGQEIQFTGSAQQADAYVWNFGDQNTSTEQNPAHIYNAAGTYQVTFTASNATCQTVSTLSVSVGTNTASIADPLAEAGVRLWTDGSAAYLQFGETWAGKTVFTLYDLQGKKVYQKQLTDATGTQTLDCAPLAAGTYTAELLHNGTKVARKLVMGIQ